MPINRLHSTQTAADGVHTVIAYEYANAAARTGAMGLVAGDKGKIAHQLDNNSYWLLTVPAGPTWVAIFGPGGGGGLAKRSGIAVPGAFSGNPKEATITFTTPMPSTSYAVVVEAVTINNRSYALRVESKLASGFTIDLGANNLSDLVEVTWQVIESGEE